MKEEIFFSCTTMLILFQGFYLMVNPSATWSFGIGAIMGFIGTALLIGVLSGIQAITFGLSETSVRILFITASILNLMFGFTVNVTIGPYNAILPVGMGILYPTAWNIFATNTGDFLGYLGFMFITGMVVLMLISGLLMAAGTGE